VHDATGNTFELEFCMVARWQNAEIVEENLFYDQVGFLRQIGVLSAIRTPAGRGLGLVRIAAACRIPPGPLAIFRERCATFGKHNESNSTPVRCHEDRSRQCWFSG
jgi:hypothetical protein